MVLVAQVGSLTLRKLRSLSVAGCKGLTTGTILEATKGAATLQEGPRVVEEAPAATTQEMEAAAKELKALLS